jgi:hypothetical protein
MSRRVTLRNKQKGHKKTMRISRFKKKGGERRVSPTQLAKMVRVTSLEKARKGFTDLRRRECREEELAGLARVGLPALDHFFLAQRLKARTRKGLSFWEAMNDPAEVRKLRGVVRRWGRDKKGGKGTSETTRLYYAFQLWYGTINQFRPAFAKWVYCSLGTRRGVLDFSAGWGGRCLAAMAMGVPYYGFDANQELRGGYSRMVRALGDEGPGSDGSGDERVTMTFGPSEDVDFSKYRGKYDLVFTSPPYFTIEQYRGMPRYGSREGFLEKFFRPVVRGVWANLVRGGRMALNMPEEMYETIRGDLPKIETTMRMPIQSRTGASGGEGASELVYVWLK